MPELNTNTIKEMVEKRSEDIIAWLENLIRFPSENRPPLGSEEGIQKFIAAECIEEGWKTDVFSPEDVPGIKKHPSWLNGRDYSDGRKNVVALWKGTGKGRSLLFSGHADVAPYEPGEWKVSKPFTPIVKEGKLYGRGSADMKGGLTAAFWAMKLLREQGFVPRGDVIFESVIDEEFAGGNGTLASRLKNYNADLAVYTEPSGMKIAPACLGGFLGDIVIKGKGGMPYTGYEIPNPLEGAARIINLFSEWKKIWNCRNEHYLYTRDNSRLDLVLWDLQVRDEDEFVQMGTPLKVKISWIIWGYPGLTEKEFYKEFHQFWDSHFVADKLLKQFEIQIIPTFHYVKPWETDPESDEVTALTDTFRQYTGTEPEIAGAPFSCDMAIYGEAGNPVVILGPRGDNLHAPDEWVLIEDIQKLTGIFASLIVRWSA